MKIEHLTQAANRIAVTGGIILIACVFGEALIGRADLALPDTSQHAARSLLTFFEVAGGVGAVAWMAIMLWVSFAPNDKGATQSAVDVRLGYSQAPGVSRRNTMLDIEVPISAALDALCDVAFSLPAESKTREKCVIAEQGLRNALAKLDVANGSYVPYAWEVTQGSRVFFVSAVEFARNSYDVGSFKPLYDK